MQSKGFFIIISPKRYQHCHGYMGKKGANACRLVASPIAMSIRLSRWHCG